jgi:hypothetical protein
MKVTTALVLTGAALYIWYLERNVALLRTELAWQQGDWGPR